MAQKKGQTGNPNGRGKGVPNKTTASAREAIASFVDGNSTRLTGWLDAMAKESPKDAFNCFMSVVEYHIPKLSRAETNTTGVVTHSIHMHSNIPFAPNEQKEVE